MVREPDLTDTKSESLFAWRREVGEKTSGGGRAYEFGGETRKSGRENGQGGWASAEVLELKEKKREEKQSKSGKKKGALPGGGAGGKL